jgi:integrase
MPKAKKTKAGTWRVTIYDYKDSKGKVHQKTFTAETKREAERLAAEYTLRPKYQDLTVGEAVTSYINIKESTLSPSSVRGYRSNSRNYFESSEIGALRISKLDSAIMQRFVSDLVEDGKSPKTVRCIYSLLTSAVKMYRPDSVFAVTLPAPKKPDLYTPTSNEVNKLIESIKGDSELYIAVLLCAFGPMRRSEACAIQHTDIDRDTNTITVQRACVRHDGKGFIYKDLPKNYSSYRSIVYPQEVIEAIGRGFGYVIKDYNPETITKRFSKALEDAGLPHFRLHDLRHYSASILHAIGIPDQYIMARGGWKTDHVMKRVYRDTISDEEQTMNDKINKYSSRVI